MRNSQNPYFYHIFVYPGDAPGAITLNVVWMEKEIRCLQIVSRHVPIHLQQFPSYSNRNCKKIAIFTYRRPHFCFPWRRPCDYYAIFQKSQFLPHFCFPWGRPWGNHAKCCMDGKRRDAYKLSRCMCQSIYYHFWDTAIYLSFYHTPLHSTPPLGGSRRNIGTLFGMQKLEWCRYPMVKKFRRYLYSFWRDPRTWRTDRQCVTAKTALASHRAVKTLGKNI